MTGRYLTIAIPLRRSGGVRYAPAGDRGSVERGQQRRQAMTLHPQAVYTVPEDTARVARAAFPKGNA